MWVDREWRFTYVNDAAEPLLQTTRDRLLGRALWEAFPDVAGSPFAIKFTEPGGEVRVSCAVGGASVALAIADTRVGIAPEKLASIFEPFVQVDQRLTRPHEGVGLGLAISRDLARGMGGELTAAGTPGVGSTFTLTLPRAPQGVSSSRRPVAASTARTV